MRGGRQIRTVLQGDLGAQNEDGGPVNKVCLEMKGPQQSAMTTLLRSGY